MKLIKLDSLDSCYKIRDSFHYAFIDEDTFNFIYSLLVREIKENNLKTKYNFDYDIISVIIKELLYIAIKNYIMYLIDNIKCQKTHYIINTIINDRYLSEQIKIRLCNKEFIYEHFYVIDEISYLIDKILYISINYILDRVLVKNRERLLSSTLRFIEINHEQISFINYSFIYNIEIDNSGKVIIICD